MLCNELFVSLSSPLDLYVHLQILNMWTFVVKFWSCALAVAAGLPIGPEGPIIHMGAFLGSALSGLHSTTLRFDLGLFRHLRGSKHKRDFVTAGVAAGVAAAFDAPLGGLLFAFEEVASFWHSHLGWQVFFCCTMAVLVQVGRLPPSADHHVRNYHVACIVRLRYFCAAYSGRRSRACTLPVTNGEVTILHIYTCTTYRTILLPQ